MDYCNVLMWEMLQYSVQEKLQWSVSNQDPWVGQTVSGQIQLSMSHWNYSHSTSSLYPVMCNIFTLRSFTLAVSDNFLYPTYNTKFPLSGLHSRVILAYPNPIQSNVQYNEQRRVFRDVTSCGGTNSSLTLWQHSFTSQKTWTFSKKAVSTSIPHLSDISCSHLNILHMKWALCRHYLDGRFLSSECIP